MAYLWDYDEKKLKKTKQGRLFLLERMINYGPGKSRSSLKNRKPSFFGYVITAITGGDEYRLGDGGCSSCFGLFAH